MAGTTTNRAYPYPTSTDAPAIHTNIQSLAQAIDTDVFTNFALKASPVFTGTVSVNALDYGYTTTATAAGTTTLTVASTYFQVFTGTTTQTVVMPVTSTLTTGHSYKINNNSTGNLTVNSSGANLIVTVLPNTTVILTCIGTTLTTAADWDAEFDGFHTNTGTGSNVLSVAPSFTGTVSMAGPLFMSGGVTYTYQPAVTAISTTGANTLTIAQLLTGVITYSGAAIATFTLPTGTLMDGGITGIISNVAFEWSVVNTVAFAITMAVGTTHTYSGNLTVAANTSARFRSMRTAATTWVTYRIA